jgi:hypothetical protein
MSSITLTPAGSNLTTSSTSIPYFNTTSTGTGSGLYYDSTNVVWGNFSYPKEKEYHPLKNLSYSIYFEMDNDNLLSSNIKGIKKNKFIFNCNYIKNRIQPYEFIMKLISDKKTFSVKVDVSNVLTLNFINFQFVKIENNLNFMNSDCDFSKLKVKFKCEKILYENHNLSEKELRMDKLKKLIDNSESNCS